MKASLAFAVLLSASAAGAAAAPAAAPVPQPNRYAATAVPLERFEIRGVLVERHGGKGRPLILIPGLASGSWAWQDSIRAFAGEHAVYVLTLPGFDGRPPAGPAPLANARAAVEELIATRQLAHPVLVGHSLGGTLALAVAEDRPGMLGGVVSIDGLPVVPGTEELPAAARAEAAQRIAAGMAQVTPAAFAAQQQAYMRTVGVMDMARADELAQLSARSDPASSARYLADDVQLDLRPGLRTITAPVLLIAPFFDLDSAAQGGAQPATPAAKVEYYRSLMAGTPTLEVVALAPARHFAMLDQPQRVVDAIRAFLQGL